MMFTTYDRDNDPWTEHNYAVYYGGGFWYRNHSFARVNSVRGGRRDNFVWYDAVHGRNTWLQLSRMWLTC